MKPYIFVFLLLCLNTASFAGIITYGAVIDEGGGTYLLDSNSDSPTVTEIEESLGITIGNDAFQGSAISGLYEIKQHEWFRFAWEWSTSEAPDSDVNDFAFVSLILNDNIIFNDIDIFADISTTEDQSYSWMATESGVLSYGIGVMDAKDKKTHSSLNVSHISSVPLPATIWLFLSGLIGLIRIKKRFT